MDSYQYINHLTKFGTKGGFKPGLERVSSLLAPFGHPERNLPVIHVAGSNGKGSTIAFLKSIYGQAGYRVGAYTSPHLLTFNERIELAGRLITEEELEDLIKELDPYVQAVVDRPTYFEFVTVLALLFFSRQGAEPVLLETGLGGRLDATNITPQPLASVITSISLEHTEYLGSTLAEIAREKAGIIKPGRPVISGVRAQSACEVIAARAREVGAALRQIDDLYHYRLTASSIQGQSFLLQGEGGGREREYSIGLAGEYQVRNALLALAVVRELQTEFPVSEQAVQAGLQAAFIPGRLEKVQEYPLVLLDGAHNPEGLDRLVDFINREIDRNQTIKLIFAVLQDKDAREMLRILKSINNLELIITRNQQSRALAPRILSQIAGEEGLNFRVEPDLGTAITQVIPRTDDADVVLITGSLYTVAEAKLLLRQMK